jgi:hypothetical protein
MPTMFPTPYPSDTPSESPLESPSVSPSHEPSLLPSINPTSDPSSAPSSIPSAVPSSDPSSAPSSRPTSSFKPSFTSLASIDLGTAGDFTILSQSGISTVPNSIITGDIAVYPIADTAITGFDIVKDSSGKFSTSSQVTGIVKAAEYTAPTPGELNTAVLAMQAAYTDAQSRPTDYELLGGGEIGGKTLGPGVYTFDINVNISAGTLTFSGSATDIFIIKTSKKVLQAVDINVLLTGGALAENIFWSAAEEVVVGAGSHLEGIILGATAVIFKTGSSLNGRIFAQTAVTLDMTTVTQPVRPSSTPSLEPSSIPSG